MNKTLWRTGAAVFTVAAIVAGLLVLWNLWRPPFGVETETQHQAYDHPITRLVFTDFESSDISVTAGEPGRVEVQRDFRWSGSKPSFTERWDGETLYVSHGCANFTVSRCSIRYTVTVPPTVNVEAETSSGNVRMRNVTGSLDLTTTSGDVSINGATGSLKVRSTSGDLSTDELASTRVDINSTSGNVDLKFTTAPDDLIVESTSGDVTVKVPNDAQAYRVSVQTTSGEQRVTVDQSQRAGRAISVHATSGDVTIGYR
jgi:hypothetical protein